MSLLVPNLVERKLFDDLFGGFSGTGDLMRTDVKDMDNSFELVMNLPGIKKEDIKAELKDGYLTISATSGYGDEEKDDDGRYIRRERHYGSYSRSFYVGEELKQEDIKANFENGTLKLIIPKSQKPAIESNNYIPIEG